jgi:hypothetical protein
MLLATLIGYGAMPSSSHKNTFERMIVNVATAKNKAMITTQAILAGHRPISGVEGQAAAPKPRRHGRK